MKRILLLLPFTLMMTFALASCGPKTTEEKIQDKVDDALDRRPAEGVKDAIEDLKGNGDVSPAVSDEVKDRVDDALDRRPGEKIRDAIEDIKDDVKDKSE